MKTDFSKPAAKMRSLKFHKPSFTSCIHRKVSDGRIKQRSLDLEMGDFPLQILESKRKERLAELQAECLELKNQLSEHSLQAALLREAESGTENGMQSFSGGQFQSMHELRRFPVQDKNSSCSNGSNNNSANSVPIEESLRRQRQERLHLIRRELEEFAIKYSIGEYSEKIQGLDAQTSPLKKSKSENFLPTSISPTKDQNLFSGGPLQGANVVTAAILLRIQRQRELELQRARMELKHLAFRLKHKMDENGGNSVENSS